MISLSNVLTDNAPEQKIFFKDNLWGVGEITMYSIVISCFFNGKKY